MSIGMFLVWFGLVCFNVNPNHAYPFFINWKYKDQNIGLISVLLANTKRKGNKKPQKIAYQ